MRKIASCGRGLGLCFLSPPCVVCRDNVLVQCGGDRGPHCPFSPRGGVVGGGVPLPCYGSGDSAGPGVVTESARFSTLIRESRVEIFCAVVFVVEAPFAIERILKKPASLLMSPTSMVIMGPVDLFV